VVFNSVELFDWMLLQVASGRYEAVGITSLLLRTTNWQKAEKITKKRKVYHEFQKCIYLTNRYLAIAFCSFLFEISIIGGLFI